MIGVLGDLHLGRSLYTRDLSPYIRESMYRFYKACIHYKVNCAIQLGDVFDRSTPSEVHRKQVAQWFNEFERSKIPLYVLVGNHDATNDPTTGSALATFKASRWKYVRIIDRPITINLPKQRQLATFLPFPSPGIYRSFDAYLKDVEDDLINCSLQDYYGYRYIFTHLMIEGAKYGKQDFIYRGSDYAVPDYLVKDIGAKIIAGHIHKAQSVGSNIEIVGSAQRLRYDECNDVKYFLFVDGESYNCVFNPAVRLVEIHLDVGIDRDIKDTTDALAYLQGDVKQRHIKITSVVDESASIDWQAIENDLYARGAVNVHIDPPEKRHRKISSKRILITKDNVSIAKAFIKKHIDDPKDRNAAYAYFKRLYERTLPKF